MFTTFTFTALHPIGEDAKFVLYADGVVEVFDAERSHASVAATKPAIAAGFVPLRGVLKALAKRDSIPGFLVEGPKWKSSSLGLQTPVALREPILRLFVERRGEIYR